ncbi:hypothetical protein ACH41H_12085 [Streptomyces sp. NPDC020800]|uniref:hypothetical protein n=1 Tax=Streptomyces sp. NPDC020800 TaxID=3365092 RepID=UPI0037A7A317
MDLQVKLGEAARAETELRALPDQDLAALDCSDTAVVRARITLVRVLLHRRRADAAAAEMDRVEAAATAAGERFVPWNVRLWRARCHTAQGRYAEALAVYDEVIAAVAHAADLLGSVTEESAKCRRVAADEAGE